MGKVHSHYLWLIIKCNANKASQQAIWHEHYWLNCMLIIVFLSYRYMLDYDSADKLVDPRVREALFVTAVSNSCVNPIIYGNYMKKYWRNLTQGACQSRSASSSSSHQMYRPCRRPVLYQYTSSNASHNQYSLSNHTAHGDSTIIRVRDVPMWSLPSRGACYVEDYRFGPTRFPGREKVITILL